MDSRNARSIEDLPERFNAAVDLIDHNLAAGRGGKTAVIDRTGVHSYADLAGRVERMAQAEAVGQERSAEQHRLAADGGPRDSARFSITAAEWPAVREHLAGLAARYDGDAVRRQPA